LIVAGQRFHMSTRSASQCVQVVATFQQ